MEHLEDGLMFICRLCFPLKSQAGKSALGSLSQ